MTIANENLNTALISKLKRLTSSLEDQDYLLEILIDKMPKNCSERVNLQSIKTEIINLLQMVDDIFIENKQ